MTKKYLFVCGGTGRGLVDKRNLVGVDGVIQFDVVVERLVVQQDNETLNFAIPVSGDNILFNTVALTHKIEELTRTRASKLSDLKLIKSSHGPLIADYEKLSATHAADMVLYGELKAILDRLSTPPQERRAAEVKLATIQTAVKSILTMKRDLSSTNSPYLTLLHEIDTLEKKITTYRFVLRDLPPARLADGMAQTPIVGSSYFNRSSIMGQMDRFFANMTALNKPVANEPIVIYIISSMCGGTGQGISHHVGVRAAKYFRKMVPNASISVRFIRFGAWTYKEIAAALNYRTNTNAAMAILHDAALAYTQMGHQTNLDDDHPILSDTENANLEYQFYYLERLGVSTKPHLHAQDAEDACRAIMHEELSQTFQKMMVNIGPTDWFKGVFVRVGSWENEIESRTIYREALEHVRAKITQLVNPNQRQMVEGLRYILLPNESLANWLAVPFVQLNAPGTRGSKLQRLSMGRFDFETVADYLKSQAFSTSWARMTEFLEAYIGLQDKYDFAYEFHVGADDPQAPLAVATFEEQIAPKHTVQYIQNVVHAHEVRAMALRLLAGGGTEVSAIGQLFYRWNSMVPGLFDGDSVANARVRDNVGLFFETYIQIRTLITVVEKADVLIADIRDWLAVMVEYINKQQAMMPMQEKSGLTTSAELTDLCDGKTWLASIHDALVGNLQSAFVQNNFKSAVIWGARGLTAEGVRHVLSLPITASSQYVVNELNSHAGRTTWNSRLGEAVWWQGQHYRIGAAEQSDFSYRVFPPLPLEEYSALSNANDELAKEHGSAPMYLHSQNAFFGQRVLSVECVRPHGSLVETMLAPLLNSIQFRDSDRNVEGYIRRLAAASIGEPIYLTDEMNELIGGGRVDLRQYFNTVGGSQH